MPQDHSHSETSHAHHTRGESRRGERTRGDKAPAGRAMSAPFGEVGVLSLTTGLRLQQEMLDVLQDLGSEWLARAPSQVELALNLPNRLTAARSIADALSVYRGLARRMHDDGWRRQQPPRRLPPQDYRHRSALPGRSRAAGMN